ncbi:MAG TPA: class I SAM-dependent methyltransferase [Chloroflexota bacterium]|nr:class I SAM-dependent methyltransferase [Chloroflexota bacterium]
MTRIDDQAYLVKEQYRDASNLLARANLHERYSVNRYGWPRWVFDHLTLPAGARVLELGCGPDLLWSANRERVPDTWEITLADLSPGMIDQARHNLNGDPPRFRFAVLDAQAIPFPDVSFDAVIANHMLYHVPDIPKALAEIRRILRPSGRLLAATNGDGHLREIHQLLQEFDPGLDTWHSSFTLQNGADWLAPHFAQITMDRADRLRALSSERWEPVGGTTQRIRAHDQARACRPRHDPHQQGFRTV